MAGDQSDKLFKIVEAVYNQMDIHMDDNLRLIYLYLLQVTTNPRLIDNIWQINRYTTM